MESLSTNNLNSINPFFINYNNILYPLHIYYNNIYISNISNIPENQQMVLYQVNWQFFYIIINIYINRKLEIENNRLEFEYISLSNKTTFNPQKLTIYNIIKVFLKKPFSIQSNNGIIYSYEIFKMYPLNKSKIFDMSNEELNNMLTELTLKLTKYLNNNRYNGKMYVNKKILNEFECIQLTWRINSTETLYNDYERINEEDSSDEETNEEESSNEETNEEESNKVS